MSAIRRGFRAGSGAILRQPRGGLRSSADTIPRKNGREASDLRKIAPFGQIEHHFETCLESKRRPSEAGVSAPSAGCCLQRSLCPGFIFGTPKKPLLPSSERSTAGAHLPRHARNFFLLKSGGASRFCRFDNRREPFRTGGKRFSEKKRRGSPILAVRATEEEPIRTSREAVFLKNGGRAGAA